MPSRFNSPGTWGSTDGGPGPQRPGARHDPRVSDTRQAPDGTDTHGTDTHAPTHTFTPHSFAHPHVRPRTHPLI